MESSESNLAVDFLGWLKDGLFPERCFGCQKENWDFCPACAAVWQAALAKAVCPFCHAPSAEGKTCVACAEKTFLDGHLSLALYHDKILRGFLQKWKFNGESAAGQVLVDWLTAFPLSQILPPVDWIVTAVPLHKKRRQERGFNQAEVLAKAVAKEIDSHYYDLLARGEWTDPQAGRSAEVRQVGELDGIFQTINSVPPCVLLCDDVLTSGSTMDAAAKSLKEAGAQIVWGFSLLRAGEI